MAVKRILMPDGTIQEVHGYDTLGRQIHIDQPLSNLLINYRPQGSIVDRLFPQVPVGKQSDLYYEFDQTELWRIPDTVRAPGTAAKQIDLKVSSATFFAKNYALGSTIPIEDRVNADQVLNLREQKALMISDILHLDWELRAANLVTNSSNVGTVTTVPSLWSSRTVADPITDIDNAIRAVRGATGYVPNKMAVGWEAWNDLKFNDKIRALVFPAAGGQTGPGIPSAQQVAALFGFDEVLIGGAMRNTAAQNLPLSLSDIWGPHAFVYFVPDRPNKETPSYAYSFRWTAPGIPNMQVEDLGFDKRLKADLIDVGMYQDEKVTGKNFGVWVSSVR